MKKIISISAITLGLVFALSNDVSAQYTTYTGSGATMCTMDAYTCPNGTTVGRTGPNCQFVCPSTPTQPTYPTYPGNCYNPNSYGYSSTYGCTIPSYNNSYTYTQGCSIYYYNATTRQTTLIGYTCTTNTYTQPTYTYPSYNYYTTPYYGSQYYTYGYSNGSWYPGYSSSIFSDSYSSSYYPNYNYTSYPYTTSYTNSGCYYVNGYQVCY